MSSRIPFQRLTEAQKIKEYGSVDEWAKATIVAIDGSSNHGLFSNTNNRYNIQVNLELADGKLNLSDYEYLIKEFKLNTKQSPNKLKNYPLIPNIVNLLVGEKIGRPFNYRALQTNYGPNSPYEEAKKTKALEMARNMLISGMEEVGLITKQDLEDPDKIKTPEQLEHYMNFTWKDIREIMAQDTLNYLEYKLRLKFLFRRNFKNFIATGKAIFYVGSYHNDPVVRICHPALVDFDLSPNNEKIEKSAWVREEEYLTAAEVYDRYYDQLTEEEVKRIEQIKGSSYVNYGNYTTNTSVPIYYDSGVDNSRATKTLNGSTTLVRVAHVEWMSLKKIGIAQIQDQETGIITEEVVDETFKKDINTLEVKWHWINEVWEGTKIDSDIYVNMRPILNQRRDIDNLSECYGNYVGIQYDYCLVELLKPYQYLYNVTMFNFEKAIALAKGKALLFDMAQIPTSMGMDMEKWVYYLQTANIAFINSAEETKRGERASAHFNQFQVLDMTLANSIQYYVTVLDKLESAAQELVGVTRQRLANTQSSELVGNVERTIQQSSYITEHIFDAFADLERRTLEALVETAKQCWRDGGKKSAYVLDTGEKVFLDIDGAEFANGSYGVFIASGAKDAKIMSFIESNAMAAVQANKNNLSAVVKMMHENNVTSAIHALEQDEQRIAEQQQQLQQQQIQADRELADRKEALEKYKIDTDYLKHTEQMANNLEKEAVKAFIGQEDLDQDNDGLPDQYEIVKLSIEQQKQAAKELKDKNDAAFKTRQLDLKEKELAIKRTAANKKPSK